ncbi:LacI family DNA-binding transcriptional regulator [Micromonospora sp. NBRC 101691]|uniref:LacI family DNA-binding transcriptional regulator n=1 Tax=Micromonospora sp. NBRC 101691 TaxID=3032198 RepID=UPI0024A091E6|nr:LacI family DNA-binding transcriptional regulator [Micromonospora sp. NBRC 101691]GLY25209.1 LacI family transcriptional regulator [Micromonospora sp. NBRC 101691]
MTSASRRVTQRDIARLAGVSQATVSLVLNNRSDADVRIAPETRERVLQAIADTGYVADPVARRLASRFNRIIGVFTYEPAFPSGTRDFYHPFLLGIEEYAERVGCDLLLFTSAPVVDGRRRVFHQDNRLRLADGCILLGREIDGTELRRLNADGFPYVAVGRRDDAGGPVPYVGADYAEAVGQLVRMSLAHGHRRLAYLSVGLDAESSADRYRGFREHATGAESARHVPGTGQEPDTLLDDLHADRATIVFVEDFAYAVALELAARRRGLAVPGDLSIVTLGDPTVAVPSDVAFTGFHIPREEMGRQAVRMLADLVDGGANGVHQRLLPCELVEGETLGPPNPAVDRS